MLPSRAAGPEVGAHEAAHVAQNRAHGAARGGVDRGSADTAERDAHAAARAARQGQAVGPVDAPGAEIQRFSLGSLWDSIEGLAKDAIQTIRGWFGGEDEASSQQASSPDAGATQDEAPAQEETPALTLTDGRHFFAGVYTLVYVKGGEVVATFDAHGGPAKEQPTSNGTMPPGPTDSGDFIIDGVKPYHTPTWAWSSIDWGVKLQDKGDDVWYQLPSSVHGSLKRDANEAEAAHGEEVTLEDSHGCIHIKPADRDALLKLGAFNGGTAFKIHAYSETWSAP